MSLGFVKREVGIREQNPDARTVGRSDRDAGAGADKEHPTVGLVAFGEPRQHPVHRTGDGARIAAVGKGNDKFVAAEPIHPRAVTREGGQALCDLGEDVIADGVTERVVNILEPVEIDHR